MNPGNDSYQRAYKEFRNRLVHARLEAKLTQAEVSTRMGKAHSFISKCELGERRVDFIELLQLAEIYRKDLWFFIVK